MNAHLPADKALDLSPFFDVSMQPLCVMSADGNLLKVNAAWSRLLGGAEPNAAQSTLTALLQETDRERATTALRRLFPGPSNASFECRTLCTDGSVRDLAFRMVSVASTDHVYSAVEDLTQTKLSSSMRSVADDYYEQILDALNDMVLVKGPKSRLFWANKAFRNHYGMSNEELQGILDAPFAEPDYTLNYVKDDTFVFENGKTLDIPGEPVKRHDGEVHTFHTIKHPLRDRSGAIIGTFGISHDITEEVRQKKGIRLLEHAIGASSEGLLVADATAPGNPVAYANASCEMFLGVPKAELLNKPLEHGISQALDTGAVAELASAIAEKRSTVIDFQRRDRCGSSGWTRAAITPVRDERGQLISFIAVQTDVTSERKKQAQAIQEQRSLIERQEKTISAMSTPIIEIWSGVLTMPLIGVVDSPRAAQIMASLLSAIRESGAQFNIIDLTGVDGVDTMTADHLLQLVNAARLLGSTTILSGISPAVSMTMVTLGVDLGRLRTFRTLRTALCFVLEELGVSMATAAR